MVLVRKCPVDNNAPAHRLTVLFVFSIVHYFREMLPVAQWYHGKGHEVHILIGYSGERGMEATKRCEEYGFSVHQVPAPLQYGRHLVLSDAMQEPYKSATCHASPQCLLSRIKNTLRPVRSFVSAMRRGYRVGEFSLRCISRIGPDVVFGGPFHSAIEFHNGIMRVCREKNIPIFCLPLSPYLGQNVLIGARFQNLNADSFAELNASNNVFRRSLAKLFPDWVRERNGIKLFVFNPIAMLASRVLGLLNRRPWHEPSDGYDTVFVESTSIRTNLLREGWLESKVVVTGKPLLDNVFQNLASDEYAARLYHELGLPQNEPFILFNVEPAAEHAYATWEIHWQRFHALMRQMKAIGTPVVLSLHPLCHPKNYAFVEKEYGFVIARNYKIAELYPYCGLVVSFPCSTNSLAAIFKKPLTIYDWDDMWNGPRQDVFRIAEATHAQKPEDVGELVQEAWTMVRQRAASLTSRPPPACQRIYDCVEERLSVS